MTTEKGNQKLMLKAAGGMFVINVLFDNFYEKNVKKTKELDNLSEDQQNFLCWMIMLNLLYETQVYYWSKLSNEDEETARIFESNLNTLSKAQLGIDPILFIQDIALYTKRQNTGSFQYLGFKLPVALGIDAGGWSLEIGIDYASLLKIAGEQKLFEKGWEMPDDELNNYLSTYMEYQKENNKDKLEFEKKEDILKQRLNLKR